MKKETLTQKIVRLAIFLAMGIVLNIIESLIPLPLAVPGIKLGLANTMGLLVLYYYSLKEYIAIGLLRVFMVGLLRTGLGSMSFFISLSGWALSTLVTSLLYLFKKASIYGLSVTSSLFHQLGQIILVMIVYELAAMINYLPVLMIAGLASGLLVAFITSSIIALLNSYFHVKTTPENNLAEIDNISKNDKGMDENDNIVK